MTPTLFDDIAAPGVLRDSLGPGTAFLRGYALEPETMLFDALFAVAARSHFRHMVTPGGFRMSVAMTNCGALGWVTDRKGYRYDSLDRETQTPWPPMPKPFMQLAQSAAALAGFPDFVPDACLITSGKLLEKARAEGYDFDLLSKPVHPADLMAKLRV